MKRIGLLLFLALPILCSCRDLSLYAPEASLPPSSGKSSSYFSTSTARTESTVGEFPVSSTTVCTTSPSGSQPAPEILAPSAVLYDATHDRMLFAKDETTRRYPASMTKLLTAAVALSYCELDEVMTVGSEIYLIQPDSSVAYLRRGQQLSLSMLLDALLLPSGNDAAYVIAVNVGRMLAQDETLSDKKAVSVFCRRMTAMAHEIGAENSQFVNPDGYHDPEHYTTAADMLKIAQFSMTFPAICEISARPAMTVSLVSGEDRGWKNSNVLLNKNSPYYYPGAIGLKTGYTDEAGSCVAAVAQRKENTLIAIVMGSASSGQRWRDTIRLFNYGFGE